MSDLDRFIRSNKRSMHDNMGNGKISHCLSIISSMITGGYKANVMSTANSEDKDMKVMMPYGITSFIPKGMQVQVIYNDNGNTIVGVFDRDRPPTSPGDIIIYNKSGSYIKIDKDGKISINGDVEITGSLKVDGRVI